MLQSEQTRRNKIALKIYLAYVKSTDKPSYLPPTIKQCFMAADEIIKQGKQ